MNDSIRSKLHQRTPDVLTSIANLSNDEVFTPPDFARKMLDSVETQWAHENSGADIWSDPSVRFLDPFTKSGIFLREVTARLAEGLQTTYPNVQERINHILTNQVFGIGITELTSLMARRSVYCSKWANGKHSIATCFDDMDGNIKFERVEHTWVGATEFVETADSNGKPTQKGINGKCVFCGANQKVLDRGSSLETHAYDFIHTHTIKSRLTDLLGADMQFDVIIGNPPYQLDDGGHGASAIPIYNKFVDQAKALDPRILCMVIPARWFFGGRGLDEFRKTMLRDRRIRYLVDYPDSRKCFQGVDVAGGICYFVWDRDHEGNCTVVTHGTEAAATKVVRPLLEPGAEIFIRRNESLSILRKVMLTETGDTSLRLPESVRFNRQVSAQKPFGLRTFFRGSTTKSSTNSLFVLQSGGQAWSSKSEITVNEGLIDKWKVFTSKSSAEHAGQADKNGMRKVLSLSGILPPGSVVTETYVLLGTYDDETEAQNCYSYIATQFFRFLIAARSSAQDLSRAAYSFIPIQDFSHPWTDELLFQKYGLTKDEIGFIESTIRPMGKGFHE